MTTGLNWKEGSTSNEHIHGVCWMNCLLTSKPCQLNEEIIVCRQLVVLPPSGKICTHKIYIYIYCSFNFRISLLLSMAQSDEDKMSWIVTFKLKIVFFFKKSMMPSDLCAQSVLTVKKSFRFSSE